MQLKGIVYLKPFLDGALAPIKGVEDPVIEWFIPELAVEALDKPYPSRYCFATRLLESGCESRTVPELLDHRDVKTTMGSA